MVADSSTRGTTIPFGGGMVCLTVDTLNQLLAIAAHLTPSGCEKGNACTHHKGEHKFDKIEEMMADVYGYSRTISREMLSEYDIQHITEFYAPLVEEAREF